MSARERLAPLTGCTGLWATAFAAWIAFLAWHTATSGAGPKTPFNHFDKLVHLGYFAAGGYALALARRPALGFWAVFLVLGLAGAGHEYWQSLIPGRSGNDPYDLAADLAGASLGWLVATHPKSPFGRR